DHMTSGHTNHFDGTATTGVLDAVAGNVLLCDQNDEAGLARLLEQHDGEVAAAIIEPTGANGGKLPIDPNFLHALRRLTAETDACERANKYSDDLRRRLNEVFEEEGVPWAAYGTFSMLELFTNPDRVAIKPTRFEALDHSFASLKGERNAGIVHKMRLGMM